MNNIKWNQIDAPYVWGYEAQILGVKMEVARHYQGVWGVHLPAYFNGCGAITEFSNLQSAQYAAKVMALNLYMAALALLFCSSLERSFCRVCCTEHETHHVSCSGLSE